MEGQGVAAWSSAAAGRQGEPGSGTVAAAEFGHPADDNHVMITSSHSEASSGDDGLPQSPDSVPPPLDSAPPPRPDSVPEPPDSAPPPRPPGQKPPSPDDASE